ncbi:Protein phosphatase 2C [Pedococcus dokdonensis]|uniref:Protein phosphatase 2C n=1 Tax=Pedococcus dokdonensis TaxID=443156 RepID=A0A1H0PUX3_9MICO|nr:protein phosphatase 2C domain-containing protein [Pedococcus dokdonensis]SDP08309.1 Protein phosphatase 2C [Pedococcus dokdonensis]
MQVSWATSAGHAERPGHVNEDFVGAVADAVVVLDGAGIPGAEHLCHHGVAWYTRRLGGALLGRLPDHGRPLTDLLAAAIEEVAGLHRDTCDVADSSSPQATVAVARVAADHVDCLLLGDCTLLLARPGQDPDVLTDRREEAVRQECLRALTGMPLGSAAHDRALSGVRAEFRAGRNTVGGFWVAKDDPAAAHEAVVETASLEGLGGVGLLTNGVARLVDPYGRAGWGEVAMVLGTDGPTALVRWLRDVEGAPDDDWEAPDDDWEAPDDATAAWLALPRPSGDAHPPATRLVR